MRAVDANLLVRLIVRDASKQAAAAENFLAKGAWVSHVVLAEVAWVLDSVYGLEARQIGVAVEMLMQHEHLTLQDADVVESALTDFRRRPAVGFADCLILAIARKAGHLPLGTFDRRLAELDGAQLV